jgi:hypothetical protein
MTRGGDGALPSRGARSGALRHVAAVEPTSARRWVQSRWTHDSTGAHLIREVGSEVVEHVTASEPTLIRRHGLES